MRNWVHSDQFLFFYEFIPYGLIDNQLASIIHLSFEKQFLSFWNSWLCFFRLSSWFQDFYKLYRWSCPLQQPSWSIFLFATYFFDLHWMEPSGRGYETQEMFVFCPWFALQLFTSYILKVNFSIIHQLRIVFHFK